MQKHFLVLGITQEKIDGDFIWIASGNLYAACIPADELDKIQSPDRELLLEFDRLIREISLKISVIPFRFGSVAFATAIEEHLHSAAAHYAEVFEKIDGKLEMGIRVHVTGPVAGTAANEDVQTGKDFMLARQKVHQLERARNAGVLRALTAIKLHFGEMVSETVVHQSSRVLFESPTVSVALLVPRERIDEFQRRAETLELEAEFSCSGPWAPFSFVERS